MKLIKNDISKTTKMRTLKSWNAISTKVDLHTGNLCRNAQRACLVYMHEVWGLLCSFLDAFANESNIDDFA